MERAGDSERDNWHHWEANIAPPRSLAPFGASTQKYIWTWAAPKSLANGSVTNFCESKTAWLKYERSWPMTKTATAGSAPERSGGGPSGGAGAADGNWQPLGSIFEHHAFAAPVGS